MSLGKNEFLVLREIVLHPHRAQRKIAETTGLSLGTVNGTVKSLTAQGLIAEGGPTGWRTPSSWPQACPPASPPSPTRSPRGF